LEVHHLTRRLCDSFERAFGFFAFFDYDFAEYA